MDKWEEYRDEVETKPAWITIIFAWVGLISVFSWAIYGILTFIK